MSLSVCACTCAAAHNLENGTEQCVTILCGTGDGTAPPPSQRPGEAGAAALAASGPAGQLGAFVPNRGNEGVLADDDEYDANVFEAFQFLP